MTNAAHPVFLSVVVPTYQRPDRLRVCLEALARQQLPRERFEVIVVNDGGASPAALLEELRDRLTVRLVERENSGPAAARNAGADVARGGWIAFTDDDCVPEPLWLAALARAATETPGHLIGGGIVNALPQDLYATTTQLIVSAVYEYHERHPEVERLFNTSNLFVPAATFREMGGFSQEFPLAAGEDYDFCSRWHLAGRPSRFVGDAVVQHAHPLTLARFCRQHFNYGRGLLRFRQRAARRAGGSLRLEAPGFYLGLLTYPLRQGLGARGAVHAGLVALSQGITALGAAVETVAPARATRGRRVERFHGPARPVGTPVIEAVPAPDPENGAAAAPR